MAYRIYFGNYLAAKPGDPDTWVLPAGATRSLDFGNRQQAGTKPGPDARPGFALFCVPDGRGRLPRDRYDLVGLGHPSELPRKPALWRQYLGRDPGGDNLAQAIHRAMLGGDPRGVQEHKSITPRQDGRILTRLHGEIIGTTKFLPSGPQYTKVRDTVRADLVRQARVLPVDTMQRVVGAYAAKLFGRWDNPRFAELHSGSDFDASPRNPQTTITESFNTGDGPTLGPDLSWNEVGTWSIVSNAARHNSTTTFGNASATTALSSDDHYAQVDVTAQGSSGNHQSGVIFRCESGATPNDAYEWRHYRTIATSYFVKEIAGSRTTLGTDTSVTATPSYVLKGQMDGSDFSGWTNGNTFADTDGAITGNLLAGMWCYNLITQDNFEAADLAAPASIVPQVIHHMRQAGGL